ncbi:hypothetical protein GCM10023074_32760 [Microbispora amethystogenes]|uniref:Uncharacterized protein n=1 Tax=Microbispora amethystogenes TaxID=1427754 RepID=A0ABQ4FFI0_9ACTN|nr:hypothetical protein Mam01_37170 [Microbispora amethystogenes]
MHDAVRLDETPRPLARVVEIVETEPFGVPAGSGEQGEDLGVDRRAGAADVEGEGLDGVDPPAQPRGQEPSEFGERAQGALLDAGDAASGGGPQADRDGHRLLVVEQQRRQGGADPEPSQFDEGGHFPAMETPGLLVADLRAFYRGLRGATVSG